MRRSAPTAPRPRVAIPRKRRRSSSRRRGYLALGFVARRDALVKMYVFMKSADKEVDTRTSARMIGDVALCAGG
jgi:hypothetical protein